MTTPSRASITQRTQFGVESTYATAATQAKRWPTLVVHPAPENEANEYRTQGNKFVNLVVPNKEWSTTKFEGAGTYGEMAYLFASLYANTTPIAGAGTSQQWVFAPSNGGIDTPASFTLGHGDVNAYVQTVGNVFTGMTFEFDRSAVKVSGEGIGHQFDTTTALAVLNATQVLTITGAPTGGTFTVTFKGYTTSTIAYNAAASVVQTALQALPTVGSGGMTVTGTGPYTITIAGNLANSAQPLATASGAGLTGGTSPAAAIAAGTGGITVVENIPIQPGTITCYLDTTFSAVGTTKLNGLLSGSIALSGRWQPEWVVDASLASYGPLVEGEPKASVSLMLVADQAQAHSYFATYRAGSTVYFNLQAIGPLISGSTYYKVNWVLPLQIFKLQEYKDEGGVYAIGFEFTPIADATAAYAMQAVVINETASL